MNAQDRRDEESSDEETLEERELRLQNERVYAVSRSRGSEMDIGGELTPFTGKPKETGGEEAGEEGKSE